mgnify:CR=1 FL=1
MNSLRVDKAAKHLQEESNYAKYDVDGDGVVTDEELKTIHAINAEDKQIAQKRMSSKHKVTPMYTYDWYIKWCASITLIFGMITTSQNLYPYNLFISLVGLLGWLFVAMVWNDRALIIINAVGVTIYINGIIAWLISNHVILN